MAGRHRGTARAAQSRGLRRRPPVDRAERAARRRSLKEDALNLPNLLTFGRVAIIPLVLWLIDRGSPRDCLWAALVYALAAITDLLDGYLARRLNVVSVLGKFLDPLADKLLVTALLIVMVRMGRISEWIVVLLLSRELAVTGLRSLAGSEGVVIAAGDDGKSKTALQMVGILCLLIGYPYHINLGILDLGLVDLVPVGRALVLISLFFSITSAFSYFSLFAEAVERKSTRARSPD